MDPPLASGVELPGLSMTALEVNRGSAVFDLTLSMRDEGKGLSGYFEYNCDLFDQATIERMVRHYESLLEGAAAQPEESIEHLPLLCDREKRQAILEWNTTEVETPADRCVHELFEARAAEQPDAVALIFEDQVLSYGELNRRANQLARHLVKWGVGPETLVGISTERSPEMIIGILGVLKAGGAYLPLDPAYPPERIAFMVEDFGRRYPPYPGEAQEERRKAEGGRRNLGPRTLDPGPWTPSPWTLDLCLQPPTSNLQLICLDTDWPAIAQEPDQNPRSSVDPSNLAYVIYTSGSTGRPKGAMLSHAGLSNLTAAQRQAFGIDGESRVLQFSPLSFDASVWETFMALANGAALCLARQEVLASGVELARLISEHQVSNVTLPPSVVRVLPEEDLPTLRTVIAAGEACTPELVERWAKGREFYNAYGPTETTVCASMKLCCAGDEGSPPIGRPLPNGRLYVLDGNLEQVPAGVPGELCVGGVSLARGYLDRPELTAEKFIPDPFQMVQGPGSKVQGQGQGPGSITLQKWGRTAIFFPLPNWGEPGGERLYRTGDLVKYLPDGEIQFLGRIDQQVKVRGFRIELGEIEEALRRVEGVREGVVVAREDRLVAYVVPEKKEEPPSTEKLRSSMRQRLPEYMVPSLFVFLDALPLTPSGKVDRKALPDPQAARVSEREYAPPSNPVEEKLAAIYRDLLGLEKVGIHDNFFELGGHSLLATRLLSRIREHFTVEIPLRSVFEKPDIATLAEAISALRESSAQSEETPIKAIARESHRMKRSKLALTS